MYEGFYQLTSNPFRLAPDPNFCFSHSGYKSAREYLEYALDQGEGFVMVTGRPGTGKTMLVETFLGEADPHSVVAKRIAVSDYGADDLLRAVAYAYGMDAADLDKATMRHRIQQYFVQQEQVGRRVLLIIDEAQALRHTALEELRILVDLQTPSRLMVQLFLVGQESLQDLMSTPDMEQFQQRVIANYHLVPLSLVDTRAYIEHRLLQAGWNGDPEFTGEAVLSIYLLSKGVPRHINKVCNRVLLLGFGKGSHRFDSEDMQAISAEMREEQLTPLETHPAPLSDAEGISSIPEIRDGLLSIADLAIRADRRGAGASTISEVARRAAQDKEEVIGRDYDDSAVRNVQQFSSVNPLLDFAAATTARPGGSGTPGFDIRPGGRSVAGRIFSRCKWKETLVVTAAILAIMTISVAALPTILGSTAGKDVLSQSGHQSLLALEATASGLSGLSANTVIADDSTAKIMITPVVARTAAVDEGEQAVVPEAPGDGVQMATYEVPDSSPGGENSPVPADIDGVSNYPGFSQQPSAEMQAAAGDVNGDSSSEQDRTTALVAPVQVAPVAATNGQYESVVADTAAGDLPQETQATTDDRLPMAVEVKAEADYQPAVGDIKRYPLPGEAQQAAATGPVETASFTEMVGQIDTIQNEIITDLISRGQQLLLNYRLLTPEDDNAYGYFRAALRLDPANEDARAGIQAIVDLYVTLVGKAIDRHEYNRAERYLGRGLSVEPGNVELLALKDRIHGRAGSIPAGTSHARRRVDQSQEVAGAMERSTREAMISRITTFFNKRKAEARRGEVAAPDGWGDG